MGEAWAKARYAGRFGAEPVLVLTVVAVLHRYELAGYNPLWLVGALLLIASVYQLPAVQLALAGGDPGRRLTARIGVHLALTTAVMYLLGWGALLSVAHLHVMSMHVRMSGARAWRPAAIFSFAAIGTGQLAVQLGWIHSYVPLPEGHAVAALIVIGTVTTCRVTGQFAQQASFAASHDALTGLVNKATFQAAGARALATAGAHGRRTGLLFLDLDGFKQVNDSFGHEIGDRLLSAVGQIIRSNTYAGDVVGRIGGDEFGILLAAADEPADVLAVARRLIEAIDRDLLIDGCAVRVGASVGAVVAEPGSADMMELLRQADAAMYRAKRRQRNDCELYRAMPATTAGGR